MHQLVKKKISRYSVSEQRQKLTELGVDPSCILLFSTLWSALEARDTVFNSGKVASEAKRFFVKGMALDPVF